MAHMARAPVQNHRSTPPTAREKKPRLQGSTIVFDDDSDDDDEENDDAVEAM